MPVKTSIKALPLEVINKEKNEKASQILSPSSILPTTVLFTLQITTEAGAKLTYKINVKQSNNLMQKSVLFCDLSTNYIDYTSLSSPEDNFITANTSLEELIKEADGLPMLFIELPNISTEIIDNLLQWLFNNNDQVIDDTLTSNLASSIKSTFDFFGLLNFSTLLNLNEPYCGIIDEILVWYYFGLNEKERNIKILKNDSFVKEIIPARFVKRLAESVGEFEEKQILSNYLKIKDSKDDNGLDELSPTGDVLLAKKSRSNILEWLNSNVLTPTLRTSSPLDTVEPPTPLGSAYYCPPNTPYSPTFQRILPRTPKICSFTESIFSTSLNDEKDEKIMWDDIPLTFESSVPPNTPNLPENIIFLPNIPQNLLILTNYENIMSPNTPISPVNVIVPPNTPNSLTIISPNSPSTPSFLSPLAPPNTPNTPNVSTSSRYSTTVDGLLSSSTLTPLSPFSTQISVPPNTPTSPFIFQSINNNNNLSLNNIIINSNDNSISSSNSNSNNSSISINNISNNNGGSNKIVRKNSREKNVTIDSVLANSLMFN